MFASFNRFTLEMTKAQALSASHPGRCDEDVEALVKHKRIAWQLNQLEPDAIRAELKEYGAWSQDELADHQDNLRRLVWIAACNIKDELYERSRNTGG